MDKKLFNKYSFDNANKTPGFGKVVGEQVKKQLKNPVWHYILFGIGVLFLLTLCINKVLPYSWYGGFVITAAYSISSIGFCLLMGYSGMASLGTGGFIGIGCYSIYYVMTLSGLPFFLGILVAIVIAVVIGVIVGFISLRIESIYLVILTLGLSEILRNVYVKLQNAIVIGKVEIFGHTLKSTETMYVIIPVLVIVMIITYNIISSPTGRAMLAMKNSTAAAQAMGISLLKYRLMAFIICTVFAAVSGSMIILRNGSETASNGVGAYALITSLNVLAAVIIGGYKSIWGAIFGTFVMYGLSSTILQRIELFANHPELITIVSGVLVIVVVMFYPGGLAQLLAGLKIKIKGLFKKMKEAKYGKDIG
ncbi:MAG: branched-chain amino acid ABC transporter permease [Clostridia bacterium]|nr:branched-chain amino acid ABC transporter permease [Clostridia bacterium]